MTFQESLIVSYNCFLVQKVSHYGSLQFRQRTLTFVYANGESDKNADFEYQDISDVHVETRFTNAISNLEIRSNDDRTFLFSGLHEAPLVKDLILLLKETTMKPKISYGFMNSHKNAVQFQPLDDPVILTSCMVPANFAAVTSRIESKDTFADHLTHVGNENVVLSDWVQKDGYQERTITYDKTVVLPILGKNLIKIVETHHLFQSDKKWIIDCFSDLGKTPYADCFSPRVQLFFEDKGDNTEFICNFEMLWSSEPFVKSIILNKTTTETRDAYIQFGKQLITEVGGNADDENDDAKNAQEIEDEFGKTRKLYKIFIIALLCLTFISILLKYRTRTTTYTFYRLIMKLFTMITFMMFLIFF